MLKRCFDIAASAAGILAISPLLLFIGLLLKCSMRTPILFRQQRIGLHGRPFWMYKFCTMISDASQQGRLITVGDDPRITRVGKVLRKTKLDELPQLFNVLKGDMSFVGPRPEVRRYVEMFRADYDEILRVRPGITDLASIKYRDESTVLGMAADPEKEYVERVLPEKIRLAKEYVQRQSFFLDMAIIFGTLIRIVYH
jgi:lipopolysaccharide/colanic/teichoic acid biosynthesis glycosyltransferase